MNQSATLSRGVLVRQSQSRHTLTVTYQIGRFRRTVVLRCYERDTQAARPASLMEITLEGDRATLCPALQFRDKDNEIVGATDYYWSLDVVKCLPQQAPVRIARAVMDLALGK